jgi:putative FmdB family regulatory protein
MATYDFKCTDCEQEFELSKPMADPNPPCPECGGVLEVVIHVVPFHRVGDGWGARGQ